MNEQEESKLVGQIKQSLAQCVGYAGDELETARKQAYDYYFQRKRGDEVEGRSEIVSGDVSAMVEGNLAMMVQPLVIKRIADYCSYSEQDEEQAQLEADCVKEMVFERNNGFIELTGAIKDALLLRNCFVKVWVDERTHRRKVRRTNVSAEIVPNVLDKIGKVTVHKYDPETRTLSATIEKKTRKFRVEAVAPENFLYPKDWHRQDLEGCPFCAERHIEPRSTLIERGFPKDKVAQLQRYNNPYAAASDARLPRAVTPHSLPIDKSQERVEWYECYVVMESEDGTGELHKVSISGNHILEDDDEVSIIPYATGIALLNPHTFMGISLFDKLKSVQDRSTALERALQDNLNATNKNRTAHFDGLVEEQDLLDGRTNGSIRVKPGVVPDVRQAVTAFAVPDTSANILANLENSRKTRSEMGGASLDMSTAQMQMSDRLGSQGLDRAYSAMEQLAHFMVLVLAHTLVRSIYLIAHEVIRTQWGMPVQFKQGKQWIRSNPSEWPVRDAVKVNIGKALNERTRLSAVLDSLIQKQVLLAQNGMEEVLIDVQAFYNTLIDWLRINDIEVPERYLLDPRTDQAKNALQQKHANQQKQAEKQDSMVQQAIALEQMRVGLQKYQIDVENQFKYYDTILKAQIEEMKATVGALVNFVTVREQATQARLGNGSDAASTSTTGEEPAGQSDSEGSARAGRD